MKKIAKFIAILVGILSVLPSCSQVQEEIEKYMFVRKMQQDQQAYDAFNNDMDLMEQDKERTYRLYYVLSDEWQPTMSSLVPDLRAMQDGRFDMMPWLAERGVEHAQNTSAVFDPSKRTMTVIASGPTARLIETLFEPMRPDKYGPIATNHTFIALTLSLLSLFALLIVILFWRKRSRAKAGTGRK